MSTADFILCIIAGILLALVAINAQAAPEAHHAAPWCAAQGGRSEVAVRDRHGVAGRVDCLTRGRAWEIEHARRWRESIGQALLYAAHTGTLPGVALIVESERDCLHLERLWTALAALPEPASPAPLSVGFAVVTIGEEC